MNLFLLLCGLVFKYFQMFVCCGIICELFLSVFYMLIFGFLVWYVYVIFSCDYLDDFKVIL